VNLEDKGGKRLRRRLANPEHAQRVTEIREGMRQMDRIYAMNLAMIRRAAQLTQEDMATRLGKGQAAVSKLERQTDLLLSTLASYIQAAGAEAQLVVTVAGEEIRYDLSHLGAVDDFSESQKSKAVAIDGPRPARTRERTMAGRRSNAGGVPADRKKKITVRKRVAKASEPQKKRV
jgi:transcriptional regulator with XRE-family HTH domain